MEAYDEIADVNKPLQESPVRSMRGSFVGSIRGSIRGSCEMRESLVKCTPYEDPTTPAITVGGDDNDGPQEMARVLGVKSVVSMSLAAMTGSVLILPGPAVSFTGASAVVAIFVSGVCVLSAALSKSEIATAMPVSGGSYVYLSKAFGPMFGTMAGFGLWFSLLFKGAFGLAGFTAYMEAMMGKGVVDKWVVKAIGLILLMLMLIGNLIGLKKIKTLQKYFTLLAMGALFTLGFVSFKNYDTTVYEENFLDNGSTGFIECLGFVFMGYAGLTKICALASEIKEPEKNMPRAVLFSLAVFTPFFMLSMASCLGNVDYEDLKTDYAPFYTVAVRVQGKELGYFIGFLCITAMASMANVSLMAVSRFPYAMSRDGLLHPAFAKTLESTDAPYVSLVTATVVMGLSIIFLPVKRIAKLCSSFKLIIFILVDVSLIIFRIHDEYWYKPTFRSPLFPYTQLFGIACQTLMLCYMGMEGVVATAAICGLGFVLYAFYGQYNATFIGIIRFEKVFGMSPKNAVPVEPHDERNKKHPLTTREFEDEIWEFEEDHNLPHEAHILQVEKLELKNLEMRQEIRRIKVNLQQIQRTCKCGAASKCAEAGEVTEEVGKALDDLIVTNAVMSTNEDENARLVQKC